MKREFKQPPRIIRQLPCEEVALPEPPQQPEAPRLRLGAMIAPILSACVYAVVILVRGNGGWLTAIPMVAMSLIATAIAIYGIWEQRTISRRDRQATDTAWTTALHATDQRLQSLWRQQQAIRHANDPLELEDIIIQSQPRLWERQPNDADFLHIRIGIGDLPSSTTLKSATPRATSPYELQLQRLIKRYETLPDVPVCLDLRRWHSLGIIGADTPQTLSCLIWHIVTHHSPAHVRLMAFWPRSHDRVWGWMRFLPHTAPLTHSINYRWLGHSDTDSEATLGLINEVKHVFLERQNRPNEGPVVIVIVADAQPIPELEVLLETMGIEASGIIRIHQGTHLMALPKPCQAYINTTIQPHELALTGPQGGRRFIRTDPEPKNPDYLARTLSQWNSQTQHSQAIPSNVRLLELLKIEDAATYDPRPQWDLLPPPDDDHLSGLWAIPIGSFGAEPTQVAMLDLNEKREGVHGMIAGTTGAGKSELLTTILIGLALAHHPDRLNFLLIDFKGGATFRDLANLPHTAGLVTDLSGNQAERALIAINSELDRRKQHLNAAGVPNIKSYRRLNALPLPNLLIVIDEFDEMARDYPEIIDELIRVAKQGRSLGVHLLFATQTPSNGAIKAGLRTNLTYWIALRVVDPEDSKLMIGSADAAAIANKHPGRAYKRVGNTLTQFQSAIVTNPYEAPIERFDEPFFILDNLGRWQSPNERIRYLTNSYPTSHPSRSEADILTERICQTIEPGYAAERYRIWQPPLQSNVTISQLPTNPSNPLTISIGLADHPERAAYQVFEVDVLKLGSIAVFGSSGAGKTSALRTMFIRLCQHISPAQLHGYIIDSQGEGFGLGNNGQPRLAHIADTIPIGDGARVERLWAFLEDEISKRQNMCRNAGIEHWNPRIEQPAMPAIIVLIDGLAELADAHPNTIAQISRLMRSSRTHGIFWILSSDRQAPHVFPADLRSCLGLKIVLRLSNENDSIDLLNKPHAARMRQDEPGRGFIAKQGRPQEIQIAYPSLQPAVNHESTHFQELNAREEFRLASRCVMEQWSHIPSEACGQPLRLLPNLICSPTPPIPAEQTIWLATDNRTLEPLGIDFSQTPHWLIAGTPRSGKTMLLRTMIRGLIHHQCQLFLIDYRAALREFATVPQTVGYATESGAEAGGFGPTFIDTFETAIRAAQITTDETPSRQRIVLAIANIDLLEPADLSHLARWGKWMLQGRQLGLSCLVSGSDFAAFGGHGLIKAVKQERCAAIVGSSEINPSNLGLAARTLRWPTALDIVPGRGFFVKAGHEHIVQYWLPHTEAKERLR